MQLRTQTEAVDPEKIRKLRGATRLVAIIAAAFGAGLILLTIGIFIFFGNQLKQMELSQQQVTAGLARALRGALILLACSGAMLLITTIEMLLYLCAERGPSRT